MTMKTAGWLAAGVLGLAGCSTTPVAEPPSAVRAAPPVNYESAVNNYFDFMIRTPQTHRTLTIGAPEPSDCVMKGGGGLYAGWMVPVIYSTATSSGSASPAAAQAHPVPPSAAAAAVAANPPVAATPKAAEPRPVRTRGRTASRASHDGAAHTAAPSATPAADPGSRPAAVQPAAALNEVSITGKSYFFWFSRETINAVTERDGCP